MIGWSSLGGASSSPEGGDRVGDDPRVRPLGLPGAVGANARNQFASDLQAVGQALKAGDLTGAQQAFALMRQHRHHGHHHGAGANKTPSQTTPAASSNDVNPEIGTTINSIA